MRADHEELAGQRLDAIPWGVKQLAVLVEIDLAGATIEQEGQGEGRRVYQRKGRMTKETLIKTS